MSYLINPQLSPLPIQSLLYPGSTTRVLDHVMLWFDDRNHYKVGYTSNDPAVIRLQVQQKKARGISGSIVDWYGPNNLFIDPTTKLVMAELAAQGMGISICLDNGMMKSRPSTLTPTQYLIKVVLPYVKANYWSSPNYIKTRTGRFLMSEFGMESATPAIDWGLVVSTFPEMALLHRSASGFSKPGAGGFPWLDSTHSSASYLDLYYTELAKHPDAVRIGSAWPGFNDALAAWTMHRVADRRQGQLWLETLAVTNKYFSASNQLEFLQLVTWNDYEEGTDLEAGIDAGLVVDIKSEAGVVNASLSAGNVNMHHHWEVSVNDGPFVLNPDGAIDLRSQYYTPGDYRVQFKSVAKSFGIGGLSPVATAYGKLAPVPLVWS
jgi:hypothetical protein